MLQNPEQPDYPLIVRKYFVEMSILHPDSAPIARPEPGPPPPPALAAPPPPSHTALRFAPLRSDMVEYPGAGELLRIEWKHVLNYVNLHALRDFLAYGTATLH